MIWNKKLLLLAPFIVLFVLIGACGNMEMPNVPIINPEPQAPVYLHFEDVLIPGELSYEPDDSFVYEAGGFKAGTLVFSGYVDTLSVKDFFVDSMPHDGWHLRSTFNNPKILLLFEKEDKSCVIVIYEKTIYTYVEVWLAPAR